jgi:hypothetical protein
VGAENVIHALPLIVEEERQRLDAVSAEPFARSVLASGFDCP